MDKNNSEVDVDKFYKIINKINNKFGGITNTAVFNPSHEGLYKSPRGRVYRGVSTILTVYTPRNRESVKFFEDRKNKWQTTLNYEKLLIVAHDVRVI